MEKEIILSVLFLAGLASIGLGIATLVCGHTLLPSLFTYTGQFLVEGIVNIVGGLCLSGVIGKIAYDEYHVM